MMLQKYSRTALLLFLQPRSLVPSLLGILLSLCLHPCPLEMTSPSIPLIGYGFFPKCHRLGSVNSIRAELSRIGSPFCPGVLSHASPVLVRPEFGMSRKRKCAPFVILGSGLQVI